MHTILSILKNWENILIGTNNGFWPHKTPQLLRWNEKLKETTVCERHSLQSYLRKVMLGVYDWYNQIVVWLKRPDTYTLAEYS